MKDVIVNKCNWSGVVANGSGVVAQCTNVEVKYCGLNGVFASNGASITLIGPKMKVHHNCKDGEKYLYGLKVSDTSSTIQPVSPLTKKQVSYKNGGGGNWNTIPIQVAKAGNENIYENNSYIENDRLRF